MVTLAYIAPDGLKVDKASWELVAPKSSEGCIVQALDNGNVYCCLPLSLFLSSHKKATVSPLYFKDLKLGLGNK